MGAIDFREIPSAKGGCPDSDEWELFAREFLTAWGLTILDGPGRGPDGGRDLLAEERRVGNVESSRMKWLVSCKHFAHGGGAVGPSEESNIGDRLTTHGADGFMGLYSTIPTEALLNVLEGLRKQGKPCVVVDRAQIEDRLTRTPAMHVLGRRYFPASWKRWEARAPVAIGESYQPLKCRHCDTDLLQTPANGIVVLVHPPDAPSHYVDVYWCCKGACDRALASRLGSQGYSGWEDIEDLSIPFFFLRWAVATMNRLRDDSETYTDAAFKKFKDFTIRVAQLAMRRSTDAERERTRRLLDLPPGM